MLNNVEKPVQNVENNKIIKCDICNKIFNNRSTKSYHKKKCKIKEENNIKLLLEKKR